MPSVLSIQVGTDFAKSIGMSKKQPHRSPEQRKEEKRRRRIRDVFQFQRAMHPNATIDYEALKIEGTCEICLNYEFGRRLCRDHNHKTGAQRGLLCTNCNLGLGNFKDNPELLLRAIEYLKTRP